MKTEEAKTKPDTTRKPAAGHNPDSDGGANCTVNVEVRIEAAQSRPTKYDKRRHRWAVAAVCALVALAASVLSCILAGLTLFTAAAAAASSVVFWICLINSGDTYPEEDKYCDYSDYWGA